LTSTNFSDDQYLKQLILSLANMPQSQTCEELQQFISSFVPFFLKLNTITYLFLFKLNVTLRRAKKLLFYLAVIKSVKKLARARSKQLKNTNKRLKRERACY